MGKKEPQSNNRSSSHIVQLMLVLEVDSEEYPELVKLSPDTLLEGFMDDLAVQCDTENLSVYLTQDELVRVFYRELVDGDEKEFRAFNIVPVEENPTLTSAAKPD